MKLWIATISIVIGWFLFLLINEFFIKTSLYWFAWWTDVLMHVWGGVMIVSTWYIIFYHNVFPRAQRSKWLHPLLVLGVMIISWEIFEYVIGRTGGDNYLFDTLSDLALGFSSGLTVFWWLSSRTIRNETL